MAFAASLDPGRSRPGSRGQVPAVEAEWQVGGKGREGPRSQAPGGGDRGQVPSAVTRDRPAGDPDRQVGLRVTPSPQQGQSGGCVPSHPHPPRPGENGTLAPELEFHPLCFPKRHRTCPLGPVAEQPVRDKGFGPAGRSLRREEVTPWGCDQCVSVKGRSTGAIGTHRLKSGPGPGLAWAHAVPFRFCRLHQNLRAASPPKGHPP